MIEAQLPENEAARLAALLAYEVLDTDAEQAYDDLTRIASEICGTPIALVSLIDSERQWFKSRVGLGASETPRGLAFCAHAILEPDDIMVVSDSAKDERFFDNPIAVGAPHVKFYAGAPLVNEDGLALGTLCVIDSKPRELSASQLETLRALSRQVVSQLELRKSCKSLHTLAREVQSANEELRQFTSIAAHDLREPLRKLITFSDLLESDLGGDLPPRAGEDLSYIVSSATRMDKLVCALLELSRAGSGELEHEHLELADCASLALDALSIRSDEKHAQVKLDPLPSVFGDQVLLTQVFQNLIGNALKFTKKERPAIHITCAVENGATIVGVKDDGIGMDPKFADGIFAPFKRLHGRDSFEGTGIGLSIARKVVERHGGRIWAESKPGEGSHFRFTLDGMVPPVSSSKAA